jgi:hypothetical protein
MFVAVKPFPHGPIFVNNASTCLIEAPVNDRYLLLITSMKLYWQGLTGANTSLIGLLINDEGNNFIFSTPGANVKKLYLLVIYKFL